MRQLHHFLTRDLWILDLAEVPLWARWSLRALRVTLAAVWEFQYRLLDARASGLVYTTLLSVVPLLAVIVAVLKLFGIHERLETVLDQLLVPLGPNNHELTGWVVQFVGNFDVGVLGTVGVLGLLYTSYSLIERMEDTFNAIWRVPRGRSWTRKILVYFLLILLGPLVMVGAFGLLTSVHHHWLVQRLLDFQPLGSAVGWMTQYLPYVLLATVFTAFYKFLPHARVQPLSALVGGLAAAVLWGAAGEAFAFFVSRSTSYSAMYSGSAILVLFLLWLYVSWLIILMGAQVAFFYQHPNTYEWQYLGAHGVQAWRERAGLRMLQAFARRHIAGQPLDYVEELAGDMTVSLAMAGELIEIFLEAGFLKQIPKSERYEFARRPADIPVAEVLRVIHQGGVSNGPPPMRGSSAAGEAADVVLLRRDAAVAEALRGLTLEQLALNQHPAVPRIEDAPTAQRAAVR
ncbi:MAG: YihY/virulence factor BrkB family protein [Nitrospiraceae bacterium]